MTFPDPGRLASLDTPSLLAEARRVRDAAFGSRVTFSPKVFLPLTMLCRDACGYCTFAQPPQRLQAPYLELEQVVSIALAGARVGCHEALFTLGERPELRHEVAARWLADRGYASTIEYLVAACAAVTEASGLLPHANAGALSAAELAALRRVAPSQGMMLESLRPDLAAHRGAPDKAPARRLATLEAAGELAIPFTTGILVGIGETEADRIAALAAIAASHSRHGHVQEVIVQNFLPKPHTGMAAWPACPLDDHLRAVALARLLLPADVHVQAPPNLADVTGLLAAGVDDLGGISPLTADHVNPERPWPELERLRRAVEEDGRALVPRLAVHPQWAADADRWIDEGLRFAVLDRSDAELLGRDDPGAVLPERTEHLPGTPGTGADVRVVGERSTAWYSGAPSTPPALVDLVRTAPARPASAAVAEILDGVLAGQQTGAEQLRTLLAARGPDVRAVADVADDLRRSAVGDEVTYVRNRNINYTNVCTFRCRFCGFAKGPLSLNLRGAPYLLTLDDVAARVREAEERGATEVCLQGGIHPSFDGDYYVDVLRAVTAAAPAIHVHAFTALEVTEGARRLGEPLDSYLRRLRDAGLRSLPGTAAEILDDDVRAVLCPDKITTEEWLECHRVAHSLGLSSNVTMMFGAVESPDAWVRHLLVTRDLQRETGGFTEFVGLPYVHMASPLYLQRGARRGPTFRETLLVHAVARIAYAGTIDHVQASWVKIGVDGTRQLLAAGCDDLGGTLMDENISRAAGAEHGQEMRPEDFAAIAAPLGRPVAERTTRYGRVQREPRVPAASG